MTDKLEISEWFEQGVEKGATHMIVVCDTFDYEDYPSYAFSDAEIIEKNKHFSSASMQKVMEVYDLRADKMDQMNERRAMRLPE
jgi:hypothetical protein